MDELPPSPYARLQESLRNIAGAEMEFHLIEGLCGMPNPSAKIGVFVARLTFLQNYLSLLLNSGGTPIDYPDDDHKTAFHSDLTEHIEKLDDDINDCSRLNVAIEPSILHSKNDIVRCVRHSMHCRNEDDISRLKLCRETIGFIN